MKTIKNFKKKVSDFIYNWITNFYFKETRKRQYMDKEIGELQTHSIYVTKGYEKYKCSIFSPVECVYFALKEVYGNILSIRVTGITVEHKNKKEIWVNLHVERPGYIIGYHGKDIDKLTDVLTSRFGQKVKVNIVEDSSVKNVTYCYR